MFVGQEPHAQLFVLLGKFTDLFDFNVISVLLYYILPFLLYFVCVLFVFYFHFILFCFIFLIFLFNVNLIFLLPSFIFLFLYFLSSSFLTNIMYINVFKF